MRREMARIRLGEAAAGDAGFLAASLRKPSEIPRGYTGNTVITEWLTLNCRGDWASWSHGARVTVRFADARDRERALARFG
jgi:hypothetical protein